MNKLIFINRYASPDHSATSQLLSDLACHLAARGRDVHIVTSNQLYGDPDARLPREEIIAGVKIRRASGTRFGRLSLPGRAMDYLSFYAGSRAQLAELARPGDVIIAKTDPPLLSIAAAEIAKQRGAVLVNWVQDVFPEIAVELKVPFMRRPASTFLARLRDGSLHAAAMNVVVGERMGEYLLRLGIKRNKIAVLPNWSADEIITPISQEENSLREQWGLKGRFVVGYSGNLGRAHEYDTLLHAAQRLNGAADLTFLFIGDGHYVRQLKGRVAALRLTDRFQFRPYQDRADLGRSLGAADVHWLSLRPELEGLIVPSKFYGIAAAGRPTIAVTAPDGEISRLVLRHECGIQVNPGDGEGLVRAILALRDDLDLRHWFGANARRMSETYFTKAAALASWTALLDRLARKL